MHAAIHVRSIVKCVLVSFGYVILYMKSVKYQICGKFFTYLFCSMSLWHLMRRMCTPMSTTETLYKVRYWTVRHAVRLRLQMVAGCPLSHNASLFSNFHHHNFNCMWTFFLKGLHVRWLVSQSSHLAIAHWCCTMERSPARRSLGRFPSWDWTHTSLVMIRRLPRRRCGHMNECLESRMVLHSLYSLNVWLSCSTHEMQNGKWFNSHKQACTCTSNIPQYTFKQAIDVYVTHWCKAHLHVSLP